MDPLWSPLDMLVSGNTNGAKRAFCCGCLDPQVPDDPSTRKTGKGRGMDDGWPRRTDRSF
jgi:hypothetical protein